MFFIAIATPPNAASSGRAIFARLYCQHSGEGVIAGSPQGLHVLSSGFSRAEPAEASPPARGALWRVMAGG